MTAVAQETRRSRQSWEEKKHAVRYRKPERPADFLPDPQTLEAYDYVIEGSAQVILDMIKKEQAHRHQIEEKALSVQAAGLFTGQIIAGLIAAAVVISVTVLGLNDQFTLAAIMALVGLSALTVAFLKGREATIRKQLYRKLSSLNMHEEADALLSGKR